MSALELVANGPAVGAALAAPGHTPPDILSQLAAAIADRARWPNVAPLLRALSRPALAAWSSAREARIQPLTRTLDYLADTLRVDLDTAESDTEVSTLGHYLLGRLDALLDVCQSAMEAAVSEEALAVARNKYAPEILSHLAGVESIPRKDLMGQLDIKSESHLSNILKRMEMVGLVRRIDLGGSVSVSLGLHGEAAFRALGDERAKDGSEPGEGRSLAELTTVDQHVKDTLVALAVAPRRSPAETSGAVDPVGSLLLYGPPGCGKTSIARALAKELAAKVVRLDAATLLSSSGPESVLASSIADARRSGRTVVFLAEDDVLQSTSAAESDSRRLSPVRAALLRLLDDWALPRHVLIIGETRSPWAIETDVVGRFNAAVAVMVPDGQTRVRLLRQCLSRFDEDRDLLSQMSNWTHGWDARHILGLCNGAASFAVLRSARGSESKTKITASDVQSVLPSFRFGKIAVADPPGGVDAYAAFERGESQPRILAAQIDEAVPGSRERAATPEEADLRDFYEVCDNVIRARARLKRISFPDLDTDKDPDYLATELEDRGKLRPGFAEEFRRAQEAVRDAVMEPEQSRLSYRKTRVGSEFLSTTRALVVELKEQDDARQAGFARDRENARQRISAPELARV